MLPALSARRLKIASSLNVSIRHAIPTLTRFISFYFILCVIFYVYFRYYLTDEKDYQLPFPARVSHVEGQRPFEVAPATVPKFNPKDVFAKLMNLQRLARNHSNPKNIEPGAGLAEEPIDNYEDTKASTDLSWISNGDRKVEIYVKADEQNKESSKLIEDFRNQWFRQRKARVDWEGIIRPCERNREWSVIKPGWEKHMRSSVSHSSIISKDIRSAGEFSRVVLQTRTADGREKMIGGDAWRVYVRGPASVASTVFDNSNGTYEALFLVMQPGTYNLEVVLDYSLCDGLRDPPRRWFIEGNAQGKYQKNGLLGPLDDYLHETFGHDRQLSITVPAPRLHLGTIDILSSSASSCTKRCRFLLDGYGQWLKNLTWLPFLQDSLEWKINPYKRPNGLLWVYGDSLALRLASNANKRAMCRDLFETCQFSYNWIYPVGNEEAEKRKDDDLDFDADRVLKNIRDVLSLPEMNDSNSTLLLNIGLHYSASINFTTYQRLIDNVIDLVRETRENGDGKSELKYKTKVIWKTTTAISKEHGTVTNQTESRFITSQRILLFNAYATRAMCQAGLAVLDVHPLTDSYPSGALDIVHYPDGIFFSAEEKVAQYKSRDFQEESGQSYMIKTCIGYDELT